MNFIRLLFIFLGLLVLTNPHIIFARPVPITGEITPNTETEKIVDAKAHIIFQDGTEVIRTVFDDGKHEDGKENDSRYGTIVDLPDGIYEFFLNSTIFDESENLTYSKQSGISRVVIPSLQMDTESIITARRAGIFDHEIVVRFIDKTGEGRHWNFDMNFRVQPQICDGKIVDEKGRFLEKWYPTETAKVAFDLASYGISAIIFTSCFEGNVRDRNNNDNSYLINLSLIMGMSLKQGSTMNVGNHKTQIRIPKKKWLFKELRVKEIVPSPDIVFEEEDYRVFQWNKAAMVSPTRFNDYRIVRYDYGMPWTTILLGFIGMSVALIFERIVSHIMSLIRQGKAND